MISLPLLSCQNHLNHPGWFVPSNASKSKKTLPPGFDVGGDGGYIMFPPSRNHQGFYRRTGERRRLRVCDIPEAITVAGETYRLRVAPGLTPPTFPDAQPVEEQIFFLMNADEERFPMSLMLDRAADYAPESRDRGAFMLGLWAHANDYSHDQTLRAAGEYTDIVQGVKRTPFTLIEAQKAVASTYSTQQRVCTSA